MDKDLAPNLVVLVFPTLPSTSREAQGIARVFSCKICVEYSVPCATNDGRRERNTTGVSGRFMDVGALESYFDREWPRILSEWQRLLAFESVSTDPAYKDHCLDCAGWLIDHLRSLSFTAELWDTETKPVVFAERIVPGAPATVLFYGHYDVQPVDPLNEWTSPPFEGTIRDGRLYARGAEDNKGQLFFVVKAIEALIREGALNLSVKILIEGEEECGSPALYANLPQWRDRLRADLLLVCDTGTPSPDIGAITMGLRGVTSCTVLVEGPHTDLHSGIHGGVAPNPALALTRILAACHDESGRVQVPGFYDGCEEPSGEVLRLASSFQIDPGTYEKNFGVPPTGGERGIPAEVRRGLRPTLEINGIHSGYGGAGMKTIIPRDAFAKLSFRLVPGQVPAKVLQSVESFLRSRLPEGLRLTISEQELAGDGGALALPATSAVARVAKEALLESGLAKVIFLWEGASVPIVAALERTVGAPPLLVGFGLPDDRIHAPDESFPLGQFRKGFLFAATLFGKIGRGALSGAQ